MALNVFQFFFLIYVCSLVKFLSFCELIFVGILLFRKDDFFLLHYLKKYCTFKNFSKFSYTPIQVEG